MGVPGPGIHFSDLDTVLQIVTSGTVLPSAISTASESSSTSTSGASATTTAAAIQTSLLSLSSGASKGAIAGGVVGGSPAKLSLRQSFGYS
ncbi:hypothetical protein BDV29DRAFT_178386 [Aspergillus leporis]|uniref:Uncharacterized protein n=1 Tax=Aspergillus leporis TaxID=41062 RepID=A0A5N5WTS0_9EURO|nr:hypothetical protein BDV29DRAFT_178386 [Aspergillus leporis]